MEQNDESKRKDVMTFDGAGAWFGEVSGDDGQTADDGARFTEDPDPGRAGDAPAIAIEEE